MGSTVSISGTTNVGGLKIATVHDSNGNEQVDLSLVSGGSVAISFGTAGGTLAGEWTALELVTVSDSRLKRDVKPLMEELRTVASAAAASQRSKGQESSAGGSPLSALLKALKPVSFRLSTIGEKEDEGVRGPVRFGFIADQVNEVLPQLVRDNLRVDCVPVGGAPLRPGQRRCGREPASVRGVVYQDLIAVLTEVAREHDGRLSSVEARVEKLEERLARVDKLEERLGAIESLLERLVVRV